MNILIDIGHPAHVHLFKNFYFEMKERGHELIFTTREKECSVSLLEAYALPYVSLGRPKKGAFRKVMGLFEFGRKIFKISKEYKIDQYLSVSSMYAAHVSFLRGKKHIVLDDTEHSKFEHLLYKPFSDVLLNPISFEKDFGSKQVKYDGFHEMAYLHPNYFNPDESIFSVLGIEKNEKYSIVRFVGWNAGHDINQKGLNLEQKVKIVNEIAKINKVFITSEEELPEELKEYQISISPEKMHDALAFANLYVGEGATMASECAMIGTPSIYINSLDAGTLKAQAKLGLLHSFRDYSGVLDQIWGILKTENSKKTYQDRAKFMIAQKIDVTRFILELSETINDSKTRAVNKELKNCKAA